MKKHLLYITLAVLFSVISCNAPIFYTIYQEVELRPPLIEGSPSNFVIFNDEMYVSSGKKLFRYLNTGEWDTPFEYQNSVLQLAVTGNYLYALCYKDNDKEKKFDIFLTRLDSDLKEDSELQEIIAPIGDCNIKSIFSANNVLFICTKNKITIDKTRNHSFYYLEDGSTDLKKISFISKTNDETEIVFYEADDFSLNGVEYDENNYYFCTNGYGMYMISSDLQAGAILIEDSQSINFTGMINLKGTDQKVVAISRNGLLYAVNEELEPMPNISLNGYPSSGALTIWEDRNDPSKKLLLAGRIEKITISSSTNYKNGYLELELDDSGIKYEMGDGEKKYSNFTEPDIKNNITSIAPRDNEHYQSTIGKQPITSIIQTPEQIDGERTLFISTQVDSVWSFRKRVNRNNEEQWQWNKEEVDHKKK